MTDLNYFKRFIFLPTDIVYGRLLLEADHDTSLNVALFNRLLDCGVRCVGESFQSFSGAWIGGCAWHIDFGLFCQRYLPGCSG